PITNECQKNSIIVLTDGDAWRDNLTTAELSQLPGFTNFACAASSADQPPPNACMNELAEWAHNNDVIQGSDPATTGKQTITTHTVGFANAGLSVPGSLIVTTAAEGGGISVAADNADTLRNEVGRLFATILEVDTSFSSPAVSVNAFNRSTHLDDLYFTLFGPVPGPHWPGNLKKYKLEFFVDTTDVDLDGDTTERIPFIADSTGADAVNKVTGFFSTSARSFWSDGVDGKDIELGGAAGEFENNGSRDVYTYTGNYTNNNGVFEPGSTADLTGSSNEVDDGNSAITDVMLNIVGLSDRIPGTSRRETLLHWAKGLDVFDLYGTAGTTSDQRLEMGDPLHSQPALVQYGTDDGTATGVPDLVAYVATNDGYLHAIDADDGSEIFSFIPQELLPNLNILMDDSTGGKTYGLDGDVVAWIEDTNGDGTISGGSEHVYLYIGMRRGGNNIYSVDVTNRNKPKLRWVIKGGIGDYAELGQTWSSINVEKIKDGSAEKTVLIFGGGYDTDQDSVTVRTADTVGRAVFIADAETGALLWSAGPGGDTVLPEMQYSIPARIKPLDLSGDGFTDRLYVADMGGQIFRFDIDNDNGSLLASSVSGGRIADLAGTGTSNARRFYYPPDVALIAEDGKTPYLALGVASGYRAHPNKLDIHDRIYLIKDNNVYNTPGSYVTVTEADLYDATLNLVGGDSANQAGRDAALGVLDTKEGWFIMLDDETNTNTWIGEKGLSEALILDGTLIVTTFIPNNSATAVNSCEPQSGTGKVYFLDLLDASPAFPVSTDERGERHENLAKGGIPPSPNVIITKGGEPTLCIGTECSAARISKGVRKTFWYEVEK
ncbi:MAG TPA: hypothetical protein ENJ87_00095, partial [Gammaproteobacteria bacterium]|nr:hypothetical protein [Gammaproteobacteria bacterium]